MGDASEHSIWSHKKRHATLPSSERTDVAAAPSEEWRKTQGSLSIEGLVFIDETWATTNMTRRDGRSKRGERLVASVPHGHRQTTTFIGAFEG